MNPGTFLVNANAQYIPLASGTVQMVVTSPPYWNLRDYDTARWKGGDPECDHSIRRWEGPKQTQGAQSGQAARADRLDRRTCARCGAVRIDAQLGQESTPDEYVANMVAVFREVWRVLRPDGTLWLNLGDSYAGSGGAHAKDHANPGLSRSAERDGVAHYRRDGGRGDLTCPTPTCTTRPASGSPRWSYPYSQGADRVEELL